MEDICSICAKSSRGLKHITPQKAWIRDEPAIGPDIATYSGWKKAPRRRPFRQRSFDSRSRGVSSSYLDFAELTRYNYEGDQRYGAGNAKTARLGPESRSKDRHSKTKGGLVAKNKYDRDMYFLDVRIAENKKASKE